MSRLVPVALIAGTVAVAATFGGAPHASAQAAGGGIVIPPSGVAQVPIAVPVPVASDMKTATLVQSVCAGDLQESGYFKLIDPKAFLANLDAEGLSIAPDDWKSVGAQGVVKGKAVVAGGKLTLNLRFYEPANGTDPIVQKDYSGSVDSARADVHDFDNAVVKALTGVDGFFGTKIAFESGNNLKMEIYVMDSDGANAYAVTNYGSVSKLPVLAPGAGTVAFTSYLRGGPAIYVVPAGGGHPHRIANYPGINIPGGFSPDGGMLTATLSQDGTSNIYTMALDGSALKQLTHESPPFMDMSPTFSPDGSQIAFMSDRDGSPQIYVMPASGGSATRVTFAGAYNAEPAWCPRTDKSVIAYTACGAGGSGCDIVSSDLKSGEVVRLTEGQGDNRTPSWAPGGRVLAFSSSRGGIWTMNADGSNQQKISNFGQTPSWGR
jgi:TolB protein